MVRRGETLWSISQRYGTTVERLARANRLSDPSQIRVGQRLASCRDTIPCMQTETCEQPGALAAGPGDLAAIGRCLSRAFEDDPVSVFLFPNARTRRRRLVGFYRMVLPLLSAHGAIYTDPEIRAAAVWQAPSPPKASRAGELLTALSMMTALRSASRRGLQLSRVVARSHPRVPHWYLGILGTSPDYQGKGIGSTVLAPILEHCDADGLPAYLESSKQRNIPFYERHGFSVTAELYVVGGPTLWPMLREPRRLASQEARPLADL